VNGSALSRLAGRIKQFHLVVLCRTIRTWPCNDHSRPILRSSSPWQPRWCASFSPGNCQTLVKETVRRWLAVILTFYGFLSVCSIEYLQRGGHSYFNLYQSFYFVMVTLSTVGYGDYVPDIWPSQLYAVVMLGVVLFVLPTMVRCLPVCCSLEHQWLPFHSFSLGTATVLRLGGAEKAGRDILIAPSQVRTTRRCMLHQSARRHHHGFSQ